MQPDTAKTPSVRAAAIMRHDPNVAATCFGRAMPKASFPGLHPLATLLISLGKKPRGTIPQKRQSPMDTPLEISFKGLDKSRAIEAKIAEKAAKLEKIFDRMTHCRVVVSAPNKHAHKGKNYEIKIDIGIPDHAPLVLTHESSVGGHVQGDLQAAIRDAFDAAKRRLDDIAEKLGAGAKAERGRRRPAKSRKAAAAPDDSDGE
jgi:putative sigma-54 modulation protein